MQERFKEHPSFPETKIEPEISEPEETKIPSIEELDALLEESEAIVKNASISEKEIDEMIEKRQEYLERLQNLEMIKEARLRRVENYNPLKDLKPTDYERLIQEKMIEAPYAERLKKLETTIAELESLDYPSAEAKAQLEKLSKTRAAFREKIESQIEQRQDEIAASREKVKNKVLEHYLGRIKKLEEKIKEIEANPQVIERLEAMAEKERKEFEAKIEKERKEIIKEAGRCIQSLSARHQNAFKRLGEILGDEKIEEKLIKIASEKDLLKQRIAFSQIRNQLIKAIIEGEGEKQLKEPEEIVPWKVATSSMRYREAIEFLHYPETENVLKTAVKAGDQQAQKLFEWREKIVQQNKALRRLFGPQWIMDPKTNEKRMGRFWAAFETRKRKDEQKLTALRKEEVEKIEKQNIEWEKAAQEIVKRGGFIAEAPIIKKIRGKKEIIGKQKVALRLEKEKSKKGNEYWKVIEIAGPSCGLKINDASPLDMRSFPYWVRESAKLYFVMRGKDFIERLIYEPEE